MRRPILTLAVAALLSLGGLVHAADDLVLTRFGDYLESLRVQAHIPALAAVMVGPNDVTWERGFGQQNIERAIAAQPFTPFHIDAITQLFTTALLLRCAEEGRLSLDDRIDRFTTGAPEPGSTLRQLLSHTNVGPDGGLVFAYRPARLDPLASAVSACRGESFRAAMTGLLDHLNMIDSVPGADVLGDVPAPGDFAAIAAFARWTGVIERLATPYAVDAQGRASPSRYVATRLTAGGGLISTARDLARFDLALKKGVLGLRAESLAQAWTPPLDRNGQRLPHGLGWFVQSYNGEPIVWQFGVGDNASSSLMILVPRRALTLILLANSDALVRPFPLSAGELTVSPFGKLFLGIFVR
jgi:CubicO group peptidase (beta-lactamase class C family)